MTDEAKRLIESVETFKFCKGRTDKGIFLENDYVLKSDFDRVVEELTRWRRVEDELPEIRRPVLLKDINGKEDYGKRIHLSGDCLFACNSGDLEEITHWRYIY
jgi:hypothetical protein